MEVNKSNKKVHRIKAQSFDLKNTGGASRINKLVSQMKEDDEDECQFSEITDNKATNKKPSLQIQSVTSLFPKSFQEEV